MGRFAFILHHRSVREYLVAKWFAELLKCETSRRAIEALFFRNQYGMDIVAPTLRPVLPWLILEDEKVRERVSEIKPEIFFEGGDPSRLPLETPQPCVPRGLRAHGERTHGTHG